MTKIIIMVVMHDVKTDGRFWVRLAGWLLMVTKAPARGENLGVNT